MLYRSLDFTFNLSIKLDVMSVFNKFQFLHPRHTLIKKKKKQPPPPPPTNTRHKTQTKCSG